MPPSTTKTLVTRRPGRPKKDDNSREQKQALTEAALEIFGEKGFEGASLSQIATRAEGDIGLIRYYFGSKSDLWFGVMRELATELAEELRSHLAKAPPSPDKTLKTIIRWFVEMSARRPYLSRIIVLEGSLDNDRAKFIATDVIGPFYQILSRLLGDAKKAGHVPEISNRTIFFMITHGGSFPMSMPTLTNSLPGGDIRSARALKRHSESIITLILRDGLKEGPTK